MTTNYRLSDYYSRASPHYTGFITNRSQIGPYTVTEKDFGDHKALYYIPSTYENDYNLSQLDERPFYGDPIKRSQSPHRRSHRHRSYDDDVEYIELPRMSPRRRQQYVRKVYYAPSPPASIVTQYIYEENPRPKQKQIIEYIIDEPPPRTKVKFDCQALKKHCSFFSLCKYVTELPPIHTENVRSQHPSQTVKPFQVYDSPSPRRSTMKQQQQQQHTPRISPSYSSQSQHPSLKEVLAENRARRGSQIPVPRREVDEDRLYDPPTYKKSFIKNDFFVYK